MYEQYTDKQIVEMLIPKLKKLGFTDFAEHHENYPMVSKLCAMLYKSGYICGQLGRSFIIGKSKRTEHWVPTTKDNVKVGGKVRYLNAEKHEQNPEFYPLQGTVGEVVSISSDITCLVQWPNYTTTCYASRFDFEVLLCE